MTTVLGNVPSLTLSVECSCGHHALVPIAGLLPRFAEWTVVEIQTRLRCQQCGRRGALKSLQIMWASGVNPMAN